MCLVHACYSDAAELAAVVRFLRRDNEIFKASLDVATQERDRLQSQLVATQQALDQARQLLKEVRGNRHLAKRRCQLVA